MQCVDLARESFALTLYPLLSLENPTFVPYGSYFLYMLPFKSGGEGVWNCDGNESNFFL